jgi:hypothetical protein
MESVNNSKLTQELFIILPKSVLHNSVYITPQLNRKKDSNPILYMYFSFLMTEE